MADTVSSVQSHYGSGDLIARILTALEDAGHDIANPAVETFFTIDQLHSGGLNTTKMQAELTGITKGARAQDAGCGVGGAARFLAHIFGCQVEAMDLTQEYVDAAIHLTGLSGLGGKINFRQGDVVELPFDDQSFDLVWCQNVTMNVEDKPRLFGEAFRVLRPGGRYAFSHAAGTDIGTPYYPLPWAREAAYSFLETEERVLGWLEAAGFKLIENHDEATAFGAPPPGALGPSVVMGPDMPQLSANMKRSVGEGRIKGMIVVAERPA
jgi:sarcosine/dimethylglycine N-methyltransferase